MTPFDRARSPWEAVLVEGLEGGRAAYFLKLHHCTHRRAGRGPDARPAAQPQARAVARQADARAAGAASTRRRSRVLAEQAAERAAVGPPSAARSPGAPRGWRARGCCGRATARSRALRFGRSLGRVLSPPPAEPSPLLRGRSLLVALRRARGRPRRAQGRRQGRRRLAQRRLHRRAARRLPPLPRAPRRRDRASCRWRCRSACAAATTRWAATASPARASRRRPASRDPAERIRLIHDFVLTARGEPALDALGLAAPVMNRMPAPLVTRWYRAQTTKLDLQASNVAGIPYAVYIAGRARSSGCSRSARCRAAP